ncbi:cytochrome P450 [Pholiota molesta]|nr:cytochrome P450 [Pholiota molesta]
MEKRSNNYSDRPYFPMLDLAGLSFSTTFQLYGPTWHAHRRVLQQTFKPVTSLEYRPIQVEKINDLLWSLLDRPEDFKTHLKTLSNDHFQELAEEMVHAVGALTYPSAAVVNVVPFLRFLPTWFPGADFHRVARETKDKVNELLDSPYKYVQDNLAAGTASSSFVANRIETCKSEDDHQLLKNIAGTAYAGIYPNVQKKAQKELDRVVGTDRLVSYHDEASLPYIQAICREDVYNGYYIPAGTTIIPNAWAMTRDPLKYENPEEFNPDRFFDENNELDNDDMTYTFGFGRRICPGRHMAAATVWLSIATILATFDIRPPKDASGNEIALNVEYTGDLVSNPRPFKCIITPRSKDAKQLIVDIRNNSV